MQNSVSLPALVLGVHARSVTYIAQVIFRSQTETLYHGCDVEEAIHFARRAMGNGRGIVSVRPLETV